MKTIFGFLNLLLITGAVLIGTCACGKSANAENLPQVQEEQYFDSGDQADDLDPDFSYPPMPRHGHFHHGARAPFPHEKGVKQNKHRIPKTWWRNAPDCPDCPDSGCPDSECPNCPEQGDDAKSQG